MSMPRDILRNVNLFIDGRGYAGQLEEVVLPKLTVKTEEHRAGGMDAPIEVDLGMEKLESTFSLTAFDADVLALWGWMPGATTGLTIRGALRGEDGTTTAVVASLRGTLREIDPGTWKPAEKATLKGALAVRYYKLQHGNRTIYDIDVVNMIRIVNGVDQLAAMRAALGR